ncbi:MAG: NfeD family protein [Bacillota bacterium]
MNKKTSLKYIITSIILSVIILFLVNPVNAQEEQKPVHVVALDGAITAGQNNYLQRQMQKALDSDSQLFLLVMNTPGGLVDATLEINELFLNAPIPVAVLVAPSGAIAASAGAFIIVASDIAAMAPGTTVGAAMPVAISPEGTSEADEKTITFYASHLRSVAREKGRPEDIAEKFVTENLTLDAREALDEGVIEYLAANTEEFLNTIDGTTVVKQGQTYNLKTENAPLNRDDMTIRERLQNWVSDPQISFMILMLGVLGIYFGLSAPGTIVPEVGGVILLVLGIYGIGLFDTNTTGVVLLLLGIGLIAAEILSSGFGVLGIGGSASLVAGAVLLPTEPLMARDWYGTFLVTVVGTVLGLVVIIIFVAQRIIHSRKTYTTGSSYFNPPEKGVVTAKIDPVGMIKSRGELWRAQSEDGSAITEGTEVEVVKAETLTLWVKPLQEDSKKTDGKEKD